MIYFALQTYIFHLSEFQSWGTGIYIVITETHYQLAPVANSWTNILILDSTSYSLKAKDHEPSKWEWFFLATKQKSCILYVGRDALYSTSVFYHIGCTYIHVYMTSNTSWSLKKDMGKKMKIYFYILMDCGFSSLRHISSKFS